MLDIANVIWCTGYRHSFPWIELPIFDGDGHPVHARGVSSTEPGLYFVGLVGQYSLSPDVLPGGGRDGAFIAKRIGARRAARRPARRPSRPSPEARGTRS